MDFGFIVDDLTRCTDEELQERALDEISLLTLLLLKHVLTPDGLREWLLGCIWLFCVAARTPDGREFVFLLLRYLGVVMGRLGRDFIQRELIPRLDDDVQEMTMTFIDEFIEEGRLKGLEQGREMERIGAASVAQLDSWTLRILDAASLDEFFAG